MKMQDAAAPSHPRFLLVSRIGRNSLHPMWVGEGRTFDVFLSCYDTDVPPVSGPGVYFEHRPGFKVAGYDGFLRAHSELWREYDYICLMDEDIRADTATLNRMFALCEAYRLKIAQPALDHESHFTYAALLRQPQWLMRHVNFIEMMCPVFRRDVLEVASQLFSLGYESGIDLIWCNLVYEGPHDFAVLDACAVTHTEPVGGKREENGFTADRGYEDDIGKVLSRYGLPWLSCVPYSARDRQGNETSSKLRMVFAFLPLFQIVPRHRPLWPRLRAMLVHVRHLLARAPRNIRVTLRDGQSGG